MTDQSSGVNLETHDGKIMPLTSQGWNAHPEK
jgi:hypothetical protein